MSLSFDKASHTYRYAGVRVPSVTQVLALINDYSKVAPAVLEIARQEGEDMHAMAELDFQDNLDEAALPEWLVPRLAALRRFVEETGFQPLAVEERMYHPIYQYAGTADLIGRLPRYPRGPIVACIDLKRSFAAKRSLGLQTAGYAAMWNLTHPREPVRRRFGLRLLATGNYDLFPCDRKDDFASFLSCVTVFRIREQMHQ